MGLLHFIQEPEHRVFNYRPRYYDPEVEERKRLFGDVDGSNERAKLEGKYVPGSSIRGAWRDGNYKRTRSSQRKITVFIGLVTLILIFLVVFYIAKLYSLIEF